MIMGSDPQSKLEVLARVFGYLCLTVVALSGIVAWRDVVLGRGWPTGSLQISEVAILLMAVTNGKYVIEVMALGLQSLRRGDAHERRRQD
jgi:hypothetical protein